jgi:2-haloacid dehalogenase
VIARVADREAMKRKRTLVFDVNETLLDLRVLDPTFERVFGDASVRRQWFGLVLRNAMTLTMTGAYRDFISVGAASLDMIADRQQVSISQADRDSIRQTMGSLPAHRDVLPNLRRLQEAGFRMAALTNSPPVPARQQLANAGIAPLLDEIMTVEAVGKFKPAREVYEMAAATLGVNTGDMRMIAAHDWDVAGAMAAGCVGALLLRPGMVTNPLYPAPDIVESGFDRLTDRIIEIERA